MSYGPPLIGVFARVFPPQDAASLAATVAGHGFGCVQLNLAALGLPTLPAEKQLAGLELERVGAAFRDAGAPVWGVSATYNMAHPDATLRAAHTARAAALIRHAPRLAATAASLCTGTRDPDDQWRHHPGNRTASAWADMLASFGPLLTAARDAGVRLAVEPEPANIVEDVDAGVRLVEALGPRARHIGFIIDPGNLAATAAPQRRQAILDDAFARLGSRTICLHGKDVVSWRDRLAGATGLDLRALGVLWKRLPTPVPLILQDVDPEDAAAVRGLLERETQ